MKHRMRRYVLALLLAWLVLCIIGEVWSRLHPSHCTSITTRPSIPVVQLRQATLPSVLRVAAVHLWLAAFDPETRRWHRWEVWQNANDGGVSWDHVHRDLMHPDAGVGGGSFEIVREWRGPEAEKILAVLHAPLRYPYTASYLPWPGPNSNTYVAWVLREAGVAADLHPMAIGKDYLGLAGAAHSTTRTGVQLDTPLLGATVGLKDGVELHLLCLTFGIDAWPPACKTPFGRLGFDEDAGGGE